MDSIDVNQPEVNHANLESTEAVEKIRELVGAAKTCFFCTAESTSDSQGVRPMSVQKVDDEGSLWFLSANDSHKNLEIEKDPRVRLYFQGSPHSDFLMLEGRATIFTDKALIEELWMPLAKAWFTEGKDDPRITVIKFTTQNGYFWDTKHSTGIAAIKILISAAIGKTLDDSLQGTVRV